MKRNLRLLIAILLIGSTNPGLAALGAPPRVTATITSHTTYAVHETEELGTTVREYVNSNGVVFGLAWSGARHPSLEKWLGTYWDEYQRAEVQSRAQPLGARVATHLRGRLIDTGHVIVARWGHMRKLQGRVYDPSLLPVGVDPNDLR